MKILIFGASGSGTTTLGKELGKCLGFTHVDVDDYYWKRTEPPFQEKIPLLQRNKKLSTDFYTQEDIVLSGSMVSWGKEWETAFHLAIFIRLENSLRMKRLQKREEERYGEKLRTSSKVKRNSTAFLEWANQYENPYFEGRSLRVHEQWMELLNCDVLKVNGETKLHIIVNQVALNIKSFHRTI